MKINIDEQHDDTILGELKYSPVWDNMILLLIGEEQLDFLQRKVSESVSDLLLWI